MKLSDEQKAIITSDAGLIGDPLKEKYGGESGEHPVFTRAMFEIDRKLMFGNPYYWQYVETCIAIMNKILLAVLLSVRRVL